MCHAVVVRPSLWEHSPQVVTRVGNGLFMGLLRGLQHLQGLHTAHEHTTRACTISPNHSEHLRLA
jgi:hypothetical protein